MRELLERLVALKQQADECAAEIEAKHGEHIRKCLRRYVNAEHATNTGYGFPSDAAEFSWRVYGPARRVCCAWSEYWAYGGHDEGSFDMPLSFLWDDAALAAYEAQRAIEKKALRDATQQREQDEKRARIAQLQKELDGAPND